MDARLVGFSVVCVSLKVALSGVTQTSLMRVIHVEYTN